MIKFVYKQYTAQMSRQAKQSASPHQQAGVVQTESALVLFDALPEDLVEMTWPALVGFSFTTKMWGDVVVSGLGEIDFQEEVSRVWSP